MRRPHFMRVLEILLNTQTYTPLPQTIAELQVLARTTNNPCTCDTCTPRDTKKFKCIRWPHLRIALASNLTTNRFGNTAFAPPKLSSRVAWPPEGMYLVRTAISYFTQPVHSLNDAQLSARATLIEWRTRRWTTIACPHSPFDGRALLPAPEMLHIWQSINTLFFGGAIPHATFRWQNIKHSVLGRTTSGFSGPTVVMNPHRTSRDFGDFVVLDFLSTLLHESVHAFLMRYACGWCHSVDADYTSGGHGRLFQILAQAIEDVFPRLIGLPVKMGRFEALLADLGVREGREGRLRRGVVPSLCDLERWGLRDVERGVGNGDVRGLIERTFAARSI